MPSLYRSYGNEIFFWFFKRINKNSIPKAVNIDKNVNKDSNLAEPKSRGEETQIV